MAVCESQLESGLARLNREGSDEAAQERTLPAVVPLTVDYRSPVSHFVPPAVDLYAARHKQDQVSSAESSETTTPVKRKRGRPRVDKTSPEYLANLAARKQAREMAAMSRAASDAPPGQKRKRGRPRVDKTSPEYLARKRAREIEALERKTKREYKRRSTAAKPITKTKPTVTRQQLATNKPMPNKPMANKAMANKPLPNKPLTNKINRTLPNKSLPVKNVSGNKSLPSKRPVRVKRLPLPKNKVAARKLPQKPGKVAPVRKMAAKNVVVRRNSKFSKVKRKDSGASSSTGDTTPRVKRKYTKRTPGAKKNDGSGGAERVKGKRGRPRKVDQTNSANRHQPKIRVRNNLMPVNNEPISLDSDDEPDLGSPGAASDSLSLDENLRAIQHIHEKYANIAKDDMFEAHLLAANFKKPDGGARPDDDVLSIRSSEGGASVKELDTRVEKLEDSSNSDSDSSSSGSSSSSSGCSSSSSGSSESDTSGSESDTPDARTHHPAPEDRSHASPAWAGGGGGGGGGGGSPASRRSSSSSDPERGAAVTPAQLSHDELSESDNESPDKSFQCHICRKWYSTRVTLKIHRRSHQSRGSGTSRSRQRGADRYHCEICDETFMRRERLYAHKAEAHRGAMTIRCEVCRRCFEHDDELAEHVHTHTEDERNGRCAECGATFPRYEQLRRHSTCAHGAAPARGPALPHACAHCGKRFSHAHSLTRHLQNHAKQLYRCVVCKASFARADQLAQHLNSHLANYKRLKP